MFVRISSSTVKKVIETPILHEIIEEEVANRRHGIASQANKVAMLDVAQCLQLCFKLMHILGEVIVKLLDCDRVAILEAALVNCA